MSIRSMFAGERQREVNGQSPPPPPRVANPRAPMLPMAMPEQSAPLLHPTAHALHQLDAALQEIRRLEGNIEGLEVIIADLRQQLREARRDREMYRGYTTEIRTHLNYVMDASKMAHSAAMEAAERSAKLEEDRPPAPPQDLDEATQSLEEHLREVTAGVQADASATEEQKS